MFDKHYIGLDLTSFENNGTLDKVSRITLMLDDGNALTAGDDTGIELVANCPHASQGMVDALLSNLKGFQYKMFSAGDANIDPAAELGDGATAGGVYSTISRIDDDGSGYMSVSAPGEAEEKDEFPGVGPMTREFNRQIAATRSSISKTADQILLEVARVDESVASLAVTADEIVGRVESVEDGFAEIALTIDGLTVTDDNGTTRIKGNSIETDSLYVKAANIRGTLTAGELQGDIIYLYDDDGRKVAKFKVNAAQTADYKLDITADAIAITTTDAGAYVFLGNADGAYFQLAGTRAYFGAHVRPDSDGGYDLGGSSYRWGNIYAANDIIQTSDKKKKKNISYTLDKFDIFFDGLLPGTYQLIDGKRDHVGLVAQDIEENLEKCGISTAEFAGFVKAEREDGNGYDYGLRYGEFVALLIDQVQKLKARVNTLEDKHGSKKSA